MTLLTADSNEPEPGFDTTLVLMHFLGGSSLEWLEVQAALAGKLRTIALDLPGFGTAGEVTGYSVTEMADYVGSKLASFNLKSYVLVGHSMSGKVAAVIARRVKNSGASHMLRGIILVAPSPPSPEPMTDEKRGAMIASLGELHRDDLAHATSYIDRNSAKDLPKQIQQRTANEVLRMNRTAWTAWLARGSKEDWSERVGILDLPSLVIAGAKDEGLGPEAQRRHTMPHLGRGRMMVVENCSHLVPLEYPDALAKLLVQFVSEVSHGPAKIPETYLSFIEGDRLSPRTKEVVKSRIEGPPVGEAILNAQQQRTLRAMLARIIPQPVEDSIDLADWIMARLASGKGDGWRYEVLLPDVEAYRNGLDKLSAQAFEEKSVKDQDAALTKLSRTEGSAESRWFEDVRSDAVEAYMAHPATLARIGYSGIGVGGATTKYKGFATLGPNESEDWEPVSLALRHPR
jgi:pimeloyl-ACP methyl ester carboxylesterase